MRGEGGILALLSLVITDRQIATRGFPILLILGIVGAAFIYGDGVITPAISVLSAMEGLNVAAPALTAWVLPLTLIVLVALFSIQFRGTGEIGRFFGPVMIVWFLSIAILGLTEIIRTPAILAAANPIYAISLLLHGGKAVLAIVGAAFLALTGAEALYADMGHVGAKPIRLAWFGVVFPALVLSYFGQGALILAHPEKAANPFFELAPGWAALPLVILAAPGDGHRQPGSDQRCILADAPGDADASAAPAADPLDFRPESRPDLYGRHQLGPDDRGDPGRHRFFARHLISAPPTASRFRGRCWSPASCCSMWCARNGAGLCPPPR